MRRHGNAASFSAATTNGPEGPFFIASISEREMRRSAYRPAWRVNDTLGFL